MKKVLVIGTSHSEGSCDDLNDGYITKGERWHDYISSKLGAEVTLLAREGTTTLQQFIAVSSYFYENPDAYFDLVLLEGRLAEYTADIPFEQTHWLETDNDPGINVDLTWFGERYNRFLDRDKRQGARDNREHQLITSVSPRFTYAVEPESRRKMFEGWMAEYMKSDMNYFTSVMGNVAIMNIVKKHTKVARFFCFIGNILENEIEELFAYHMADYIIPELYPTAINTYDVNKINYPDHFCPCNHLNPLGIKEHAWPKLEKYIKRLLEEKDGK